MTKTITILALTATLILSGLANAEAISWPGLQEIGFAGSQVYEVSGASVIPALSTRGNEVPIRCLDGDWVLGTFDNDVPAIVVTLDPSLDTTNLNISLRDVSQITERPPGVLAAKLIGLITTPEQNGAMQLFEIPVTLTILCFSPSPLSSTVGGDWQGTDTVALFIGYTVLNSYWLAPTLAGLAAGIYLTKSKWKR